MIFCIRNASLLLFQYHPEIDYYSSLQAHASLKGNNTCCRGVLTLVCASTAAPWLTRTSATLTLSSWAARWSGVSPLCKLEATSNNLQRRYMNTSIKFRYK